jgi:hypothetical protein
MKSGRKFLMYRKVDYVKGLKTSILIEGPYCLNPNFRNPGKPEIYEGGSIDGLVKKCFESGINLENGDTVETIPSESTVYSGAGPSGDLQIVPLSFIRSFLMSYRREEERMRNEGVGKD